ncbi:MAG: NAD-dependent epimerase/dehydratase family protein, partial [Thermoplasmatota archaeon]
MRVAVVGANGLLGSLISAGLRRRGHDVLAVARGDIRGLAWDGLSPFRPPGALDAVACCTGAPLVARRWGASRKRLLADSRVGIANRLVEYVASVPAGSRPALFCMSAVGYYGAWPAGPLVENAPAGTDFAALLCADWERAAQAAPTRVVMARMGLVLSPHAGYLKPFLPLFRAGLGGPIGSG